VERQDRGPARNVGLQVLDIVKRKEAGAAGTPPTISIRPVKGHLEYWYPGEKAFLEGSTSDSTISTASRRCIRTGPVLGMEPPIEIGARDAADI
jgi:hypothetical protein